MNENLTQPKIPILESAWKHYAELDAKARQVTRMTLWSKQLGLIFGLLAVLLAILAELYQAQALVVLLILAILASLAVLAWSARLYAGQSGMAFHAGADEVLKAIYYYRTILQQYPERRQWLLNRLSAIQRNVLQGTGNELVTQPYNGAIPPVSPSVSKDDDGYQDLNPEAYQRIRLESQIAESLLNARTAQRQRTFYQVLILVIGGGSLALAVFAPIWTALTAALLLALLGWGEIRQLDSAIQSYSKTNVELRLLQDRWSNLEPEERTPAEFMLIVRDTEELVWSHNAGQIPVSQIGLSWAQDEDARLVATLVHRAQEADAQLRQALQQSQAFPGMVGEISSLEPAAAEHSLEPRATARGLESARQRRPTLEETLKGINLKYAGVKLTKETPKEVLNEVLKQFPPSGEIKG